jgi:uncharacterized damage-inducible protein DinB
MIQRFRRWFEYEKNAHAKVLNSLETVPAERRESAEYRRALEILGHVAAARLMWLARLGLGPRPADLFPKGVAQVASQLQAAHDSWDKYLATLDDEALARSFDYQAIDGARYRNLLEEILTQLFTHSSSHRGQIAMLVRQSGGEPALTDFIYWSRESLPPQASG